MRWSIIRLIWFRELKDQLRDRRTLFMIAVLPLLLYPFLGFAVLQFGWGFAERISVIGVVAGPGNTGDFPETSAPPSAVPVPSSSYYPFLRKKQLNLPASKDFPAQD